MWYPISLKIVNLFSYQDSKIDFLRRKGRMTCIYGSNQTDPKTLSNGSGKTSLLDCIAIALTGSPLRQINKKDIVRNGYTSGSLELMLKNDVTNQELLIKELIEKTKSNKVELYENGQLNTQLKDLAPKEAHKYILSLIDISEDDLLNYYLLGKDTYQSFFTTKDSEKKEVINRFSKANVVDPIDDFIKADIKDIEAQLIRVDQVITGKNAKVEVLEEQILDLKLVDNDAVKQLLIESLELRIVEISEKIDLLKDEIVTDSIICTQTKATLMTLKENVSWSNQLIELTSQINELNINIQKQREDYINIDKKYEPAIHEVNNEIEKGTRGIDKNKSEKNNINDLISEIERHIADEIECPSCHHKFCFKDGEYNLEEAKIRLSELRNKILKLEQQISTFRQQVLAEEIVKKEVQQQKVDEQKELIKIGNDLKTQLSNLNAKEIKIKTEISAQQITIDRLNSAISTHKINEKIKLDNIDAFNKQIEQLLSQIDEEEKREVEDKTKPIRVQIEQLGQELDEVYKERDKIIEQIESLNTWKQRFKKFKSHLANNSIGMIESLSNHYLEGMGTNLSVAIDGFKEKADGTLKEEITTDISRDGGISLESFYKFSGGEKAKIDVSGILSMQKLINLNSKSGGLDLLWIDEIVDSIDRVALNELVSSLDKLNQTILLISHIELNEIENSIKVEKRLGISQIIE